MVGDNEGTGLSPSLQRPWFQMPCIGSLDYIHFDGHFISTNQPAGVEQNRIISYFKTGRTTEKIQELCFPGGTIPAKNSVELKQTQ